ncbi:hypothetical protein TWF730_002561 [Orbilia blumenaviensis]|uniref:Uncharacterized protein n=1 Tax=Orbilia blumenaviensis TaxID=1796055 RepID=A0AAV9UAH5_9PEZI
MLEADFISHGEGRVTATGAPAHIVVVSCPWSQHSFFQDSTLGALPPDDNDFPEIITNNMRKLGHTGAPLDPNFVPAYPSIRVTKDPY